MHTNAPPRPERHLHAVVVGGTSGIGEAVLVRLIAAGYHVSFTYNSKPEAATTLSERFPGLAVGHRVDLASLGQVGDFVARLSEGPVPDTLVNCAGVLQEGLSIGGVVERLHLTTTINYLAPATIASEVAALMMPKRRGTIVNVTSVAGRKASIGNAMYGGSKVALERYTASLALEVARFRIRTLCVAPGFVDTPMFRNFSKEKGPDVIRSLPMREILKPEDVADPIISFIDGRIKSTGTTMVLGNGETTF